MSRDYRFKIRPNGGNGIQVEFEGPGQPLAGALFQRTLPQLNPSQIDSFRRGAVQPNEVDQLSDNVSNWLLGADLRQTLTLLMNDPNPLRLVFAIDGSLQPMFGDVPIELLRIDPVSDHLVIHARVKSILHLLPKVVGSGGLMATLDWPMRILLVRSNPDDLGGLVPPAVPLRDDIMKIANAKYGQGQNMVQVDIHSSEAGAAGPPTWAAFRQAVRTPYHVLVYLGHGDVQQLHEDLPPLSILQFESEDAAFHESVTSKQLANVLRQNPIPVVVLAGCLTAAQPDTGLLTNLSTWMRGNQGVAQALVNSESGVDFAIGMRSKIDADDARSFLKEFFRELVDSDNGNVELAVRAGRQELFQSKPYPPNWAAPMAFTGLAFEPVFEYLTRKITFQMTPELNKHLEFRRVFWSLLADQPPGSRRSSLTTVVDENRKHIRAEVLAHGAMLLPELVDAQPGQATVLKVTLEGNFVCQHLQAKLAMAPGLAFVTSRGTKLLSDAGYQVLNDAQDLGVFQVQLKPGAAPPPRLPNGIILEIDLQVAGDARGICPVNLEVLSTDCKQPFWPGNNAVIVAAA